MELKPSPETDDYRYFDPKLLKPSEGGSTAPLKSRAQFQDAIVFMVGGGTYAEYQNLVDYAKVLNFFFFFFFLNLRLFNYFLLFPVENSGR
jgi:hypothetical protein